MASRLRKMKIDFVSFVDSPAEDGSRVMLAKRDFSQHQRDMMAEKGMAMSGGGFPIATRKDLSNAIQAYGRAKNPDEAKRHIIKRARDLGAVDMLPEDWKVSKSDPVTGDVHVPVPMGDKKTGKGAQAARKKLLVDGQKDEGEVTDDVVEETTEPTTVGTKVKKALESLAESLGFEIEKNTTEQVDVDTVSDDGDLEDDPMPSEQLEKVLKGDFSTLPEELREYIEKLEDRVIELEETAERGGPEDDPDGAPDAPDDGGDEVLKSASPAVRELFQKMAGELAETQAIAKAERDARLDREFTELAKSFGNLPSSTDEIKAVLKNASEGDRDAYEKVVTLLTSANEAAKHSALLEEVGKRAPAEGSAEDKAEKIAKGYRDADPDLTAEQAYDKALRDNPGLYAEMMED